MPGSMGRCIEGGTGDSWSVLLDKAAFPGLGNAAFSWASSRDAAPGPHEARSASLTRQRAPAGASHGASLIAAKVMQFLRGT